MRLLTALFLAFLLSACSGGTPDAKTDSIRHLRESLRVKTMALLGVVYQIS